MADPPRVNRSSNTGVESGTETDAEHHEPLRLEGTFSDLNRSETPHTRLALFYETHEELFEAAIPFVKEGLERGERCWYIVDETTEAEVVEAFRDAGVDVESARQTGDFDIHSTDTEFEGENGEFDPTAMIDAWTDRARETTEQGEYEGLRIVCEATWQLDSDTDERIAGAKDHEHRLNELFSREECLGLCAYNRERFPPEALEAALEHHPQVLSDGMLAENCYYVPPEESFDSAESVVDRQLQTLSERARTTRERRESEKRLQNAISIDTVGVLFFALDGGISHANEAFERMSGYSQDDLHDTDWEDLTPPEFMDATERKAEELATQGNPEPYEKQLICEDGSQWWALCAPKRLSDSEEDTECIEFIIDITERKRQERLQEEQTRLLERIASGAPLEECLTSLCTTVSTLDPNVRASIVLSDDENQSFEQCIAPELSPAWHEELVGLPIDDRQTGTCGEAVFRGTPVTCEDVETNERWSADWTELCLANDVLAGHSVPIHDEDGEPLGSFMLCFDEPRTPDEWEQLSEFGTHVASIALERERTTRSLREGEEKYRTLFESIIEGFCINEIIYDEDGETPIDYRIIESNPKFEEYTGLVDAEGKTVNEMGADLERFWYETYGEIARTREATRFEHQVEDWGRWFSVYAFPHGDPEENRIGVLFNDITERKQREERQEFLLRLNDALGPLAEATDIQQTASRLLGEHLDVSRTMYAEVHGEGDGAEGLVRGQYVREGDPFPDRFPYKVINEGFSDETMQANECVVVADVASDPRLTEDVRQNWLAGGIAAVVAVPLIKNGRVVAIFGVHHARPRDWSSGEVALIEDVAEHTWAAAERARVEEDLREGEERLTAATDAAEMGVWEIDLQTSEALYTSLRYAEILGYDEVPEDWSLDHALEHYPPEDRERLMTWLEDGIGESMFESRIIRTDGEQRWISVGGEVYEDDEGEPVRAVGTVQDITDRKRAEANQELLVKITDDLSQSATSDEIMQAAGARLGEHLNLNWCFFSDVDEEQGEVTVHHSWQIQSMPSRKQTFRIDEYVGDDFARSQRAGETFIVRDTVTDERTDPEAYANLSVRSILAVPFHRNGRWVACLTVTDPSPRDWRADEIEIVQDIAEYIFPQIERARAESALQKSEEKYRTLFDSMDEGYCIIKMIFDGDDKPVDYRFVETNSAFGEQFGIEDVDGRRMLEINPEHESYWFDIYGHVAKTGEPRRFADEVKGVDRVFDVYAYRIGEPEERRVAVLFTDITERKEREDGQEFLLELSDALRTESDPDAVGARATRMLAEYMEVDRCHVIRFSRAQGLGWVGPEHHAPELPSLAGEYRYADFPETMQRLETDPLIIHDLWNDASLSEADKQSIEAMDMHAAMTTPLRRGEREVVWALNVGEKNPRTWTDQDRILVEDAAERTWAAMERTRAEEELRESEKRQRLALEAGEMGVWELELQTNDSPERTPRHDAIFGYEEPLEDWSFKMFLEHVHPDDREQVEENFEKAYETGVWKFETRIIRADDEQRWITARGEFYDDGGEPVRAVGTVQDITERKQREEQLARQREQIETFQNRLLETSPTGILVTDASGEITLVNDRTAEIVGTTPDEMVGLSHDAPALGIVGPDGEALPDERLPFERVRRSGQAVFNTEVGIMDSDGERVWLSVNAAPLYDDGELSEMVATVDDITEQKRYENTLTQLNDATRELIDADAEAIRDHTAEIARNILGVELTALWTYNGDSGELELHDTSTDEETKSASIEYPERFDERAWNAFVTNEMRVEDDLLPADDGSSIKKSTRSGVIVPLGRHGVLYAGSTSPNEFDETRVDLAETVAGTLETALNRADHEQQLAQQNDELTHLNRINEIIRGIDQVLVEANTREEITHAVCERLADSDLYEFAWVGEYDPTTETVEPKEWSGVESGYLDGLTITTDDTETGQGPISTALRTGELQVIEDILTDSAFAPWREETLATGVRSCVAIPLVYDETPYGVLTVYASDPQSIDHDRSVLHQLGETIAHAIDTVETRRTLQTNSVVELDVHIPAPEDSLCQLARETGCRIEFDGLIPGSDGTTQLFFTASGVPTEDILTYGEESLLFEELSCLTDRKGDSTFKTVCVNGTLPGELLDRGVGIRTLTIEDEDATAVINLPAALDPRDFIEGLQVEYPGTELRARRSREQPTSARNDLQSALDERLTDRQQEVLRTAYLSGYFESPRVSTGKEVTATLGISQPTFTQHLRAGQRKVFSMVFDESPQFA